ncbi:prolyl endopeptidase-like [Plectropomus leopardus]|uniref:prolyl endopeptidase-like n=1 Tax=Plectropomus leopardus TaxID=160734 RepID=UPI001C4C6EE2|nr:prolyl endopeptidase-like [Plectropomus leopardus]XP_042362209.1 prolyl endopeptidase-like [Plectropomus leopardus]XP_042362210.1 prolyl endopeptidase-like [Plectropomus leopardus]
METQAEQRNTLGHPALVYPTARRDDSKVNDYHGTKICDPYSWLEDPDSTETMAFVEEQNKLTMPYLEQCAVRAQFHQRLTELYDYPKYSCPYKRGKRYFYFHNKGLQNQSVLYVQDSLDGAPSVFLDPNKFSEDGTVALQMGRLSEECEYFAYGLSSGGSDWVTISFMKADDLTTLPDVLERVKFSCLAWTHDAKGVFYNCYPPQEGKTDGTETTSNINQKLYYHAIGTKQSEDILVAEFPENPKWLSSVTISDDGRYAVMSITEGCEPVNQLWYCDLQQLPNGITGLLPWVKLVDNFDAQYSYVTNEGTVFTFRSNLNAPRYCLINIDIQKPDKQHWTTLIPQHDKDVLGDVSCVNQHHLLVNYVHDVKDVLQVYELSTGQLVRDLPLDVGTVVGVSCKKKHSDVFYKFTSFTTPGIIYHCDLSESNPEPKVFRMVEVKGIKQEDYETKQVFYPSKDGTRIPMFLVHAKGLKKDGTHPVFLYGYGGFETSIQPFYNVAYLLYVRHLGGILAVANIRGGGEYGLTWHKAGTLGKKQNGFDDFQCAAEYLIQEKYTTARRIAINGASNGGLLVAACVNQRPDLFGCAVAEVGVMDMLKFHKFTIGHAWTTDYGCADDPEQFNWLIKYSPLHNLPQPPYSGPPYPAVLLLTADHDDRVVPLHTLKYCAALQHGVGSSSVQRQPLMVRVDIRSGHGAGKPTSKAILEDTHIFSFIAETLGLSWND